MITNSTAGGAHGVARFGIWAHLEKRKTTQHNKHKIGPGMSFIMFGNIGKGSSRRLNSAVNVPNVPAPGAPLLVPGVLVVGLAHFTLAHLQI